ncbi:FadD3 family acyl-CoA ligase [Spongisporangium articulatum]|uniref:FadD3 family acyl-CoA ligase n=1 Tax=Spongisporangium articulatum TaxID=3362603 RepID=A0ABW8AUV5_9ACTN
MTTPRTIPAAVRRAAERFGDRPAVLDGDSWVTYRELADGVRATAAAFVAHGVGPGDRVCVWAPNSLRWMLAALGAQYIGAVLVPLNTRYRGEAADVVLRTRARVLVVDQGFLGTDQWGLLCGGAPEGLPDLDTVVTLGDPAPGALDWTTFLAGAAREHAHRAEVLADAVTADTVADILFTSGTTGRAKGAVAGHRQALEVAQSWAELAGVTADDRYLVVNPFFHSFGSKAGYLVCLSRGAGCLPVPVFDVPRVLDLARRERVTVMPGPPTLFSSLLDAPGAADALAAMRVAVTGAAIVPEALIVRMREELRIPVVLTAYGLTEAPVVTMCTPGDDARTVATTCGRAVRDTELRTLRADGSHTAVGEPGELLVRSPQVLTGYLDDPEATAAAVDADGWLHTGDVAVLDERGYLRITDRKKDMFTVGGFNVYPAEVERLLAGHPAVRESAVIGVPDERLGEVPRAYVVLRAGRSAEPDELIAFCRDRLAHFKAPRTVVLLGDLPRNAGGKVLKTDLREQP